jgi:uncharacterized caspase-like protein
MRFFIALVLVALLGGMGAALAEKRVALVIGNSNYLRAAKLPNPANDAADMAALLSKLGFKVIHQDNLGYFAFRRALQEFGREAEGTDLALVFFAGHGVEVENKNFLIPTDVSLSADSDVEFEAIPLDLVMNALSRVSGVRVVLLDACRDNPFISTMKRANATRSIGRGLAAIEPAAGTLVGYAAKEGTTAFDGGGRNSPYTAGLLAHLGEPGSDIQFVFRKVRDTVVAITEGKQEPYTYGSLPGRQIFIAPPQEEQSQVLPPNRSKSDANAIELEFWRSVQGSKSRGALEKYMEAYPNGVFAALAKLQIEQFKEADDRSRDGERPSSAPDDLTRKIQVELSRVGCDPGNADGMWGQRSREALRRFIRHSGSDLDISRPTSNILEELEQRTARVCPVVAARPKPTVPPVMKKPNFKPRETAVENRVEPRSVSKPARLCRVETRDECRVRARAAGASRGSGFCRNRLTICQ